jgi:hypothetical protein
MNDSNEVPFQLLHGELVKKVLYQSSDRVKALSDLESIGFSVGYRLVEKITREHPKFKDELELIKFICKDYWMCIFHKQVDNLRTNNRDVYVLSDKSFKSLSSTSASNQHFEDASAFLVFTCGLLRGTLANLGVKSVVTSEVISLPAVKFQIQVQRN